MLELGVGRLLELHELLVIEKGHFERALRALEAEGKGSFKVERHHFLNLRDAVSEVEAIVANAKLTSTHQAATRTKQFLHQVGDVPENASLAFAIEGCGNVFRHLMDLCSRLRDDCHARMYFQFSAEGAELMRAKEPLFGREVFDQFPKSQIDIEEAGKCLALRRNKATVFHLMLAMEEALRALAAKANATVYDKHGNFDRWMVIVGNLKAAIPALPAAEQETWMDVHNLLWGVGKSWRNGTMHPADAYSDEDAETIFNSVKSFMRYLAPLV